MPPVLCEEDIGVNLQRRGLAKDHSDPPADPRL